MQEHSHQIVPTNKNNDQIGSDWATVAQICSRYPIGKTLLYSYMDINGGKIKTANLKKIGAVRGKRLVSVLSISNFIESQIEGGEKRKERAK